MPTITATPDINGSRIVVNLAGWASSETTIYRRAGSGRVPVRSANPIAVSGGVALVSDWEMPLNTSVTYEALDGTNLYTTSATQVADLRTWLKIPSYPALNRVVHLASAPSLERARRQSAFGVLGRREPIVVSDLRSSATGSLSFITLTEDEAAALGQIFDIAQVVQLQVRGTFGSRYLAIGDLSENPLTRLLAEEARQWDVPFIEVGLPLGAVIGDPSSTYQMVKDTYPTYGDLRVGEADYLDLVAGVDPPLITPDPDPDPPPDPDPDPPPPPPPPPTDEDEIMALGVVYSSDWPTTAPKRPEGTYTAYCTGTNDHVKIQAVIDAVATYGGGSVYLAGKLFNIGAAVKLKTGIELYGGGLGTVVKASSSFGTGMIMLHEVRVAGTDTYGAHATILHSLTLDGNGRDVHGVHYIANSGQIFTSTPSTNPDPNHIIHDIYVTNTGSSTFAGHGIRMTGGNLRGCKLRSIRTLAVRGCGVFIEGSVDSTYTDIECGSSGNSGPAPSTSSTTPVGHGFYVSGDQNSLVGCKAWYSRWAGFYNRAVRTRYVNCEGQDNYSGGFEFVWGKSSAVGCQADSNGQAMGADGRRQAGFHIAADRVTIQACLSYDKGESGTSWQQQYGFQVNSGFASGRLDGCITYGNVASVSGTAGAGTTMDIESADGT